MWNKLNELADQNQFELLIDGDRKYKDEDIRLVYLMNDAVESFLVFKNATLTGEYIPEFDGDIWIDVDKEDNRKTVILHQEENVVTLFFDDLDFEIHLYNYGNVGHFWIGKYEYLRQLEFKIAILGDKYQYIGADACSDLELELVKLVNFPPLSYMFYPAVPKKYITPKDNPWLVSEDAVNLMIELASNIGNKGLIRWLRIYKKMPTKLMGAVMATKLHRTKNIGIIKELMKMFREGCKDYPSRNNINIASLLGDNDADEIFIEEPFVFASDGIKKHVYKGIWEYGIINTKMKIIEI